MMTVNGSGVKARGRTKGSTIPFNEVELIIAQNLRKFRGWLRRTQADVGKSMREAGYSTWSQMTVTNTEGDKPTRHIKAGELYALAGIYGVPVESFYEDNETFPVPIEDEEKVQLKADNAALKLAIKAIKN
jgi:transcriptional regulator with XRE-family HTH domain